MYIKQVDRKKCAAFLVEHYSFAYKDAVNLVQSVADSAPGSRAVYDVITNEQYDNVFWSMAADNAGIKHDIHLENIQKIEADIISNSDFDELPDGLVMAIKDKIKEYCIENDIDNLRSAPAPLWGACCIYIGKYIKQTKITIDMEKQKRSGGAPRNIKVLSALADLWEELSSVYNKPLVMGDFCNFAGISKYYFYSNTQRAAGLTSEDVQLHKKVFSIFENGLQQRLMDGKISAMGNMYLGNVIAGYTPKTQTEHILSDSISTAKQLPRFNDTSLTETSEKP